MVSISSDDAKAVQIEASKVFGQFANCLKHFEKKLDQNEIGNPLSHCAGFFIGGR